MSARPGRNIYTAFAERDDITFIMEEINDENGEYITTRCVGWYAGEPNDENTKTFTDCLTVNVEWLKKHNLAIE